MGKRIRNTAIAAAIAAGAGGAATSAHAANWILLQGTEPFGKAHTLQMWGFMQPTFRQIDDKEISGTGTPFDGYRATFNTLGPDRRSAQSFSLFRARLGARGVMHPVNDKINYFFLAEFGDNGITRLGDPGSGSVKPQLTDASVTFRQLAGGGSADPWKPGVSFRFGEFKMPLADEGSRGIMSFDYINFSEVTRQQVLERYVRANSGPKQGIDGSIGAFRDIGVQLFDEIKLSPKWEMTWALGAGNGNGLNRLDNDDNIDTYERLQAAYVFDGVSRGGPRREDIKVFAWAHQGMRQFDANASGTYESNEEFGRKRYGVGFHFYKQPYRFSGEYIWGNGMVFNGVTRLAGGSPAPGPGLSDPSTTWGHIPQMAPGEDNTFHGWYLEGGYFPIPNKLGLEARYDVLDRLDGTSSNYTNADERKFETLTLGVQYWNHPVKGQWTLTYRMRNLSAPNNDTADKIGESMGNEIGIQYFLLFKNVALR
ncbi:MAG TPA: hypothetical protein VKA55_06190 [Gammaproteobacteria bacterium]|nr:hypothetical protein [Gammaproteobacteria bacterium]